MADIKLRDTDGKFHIFRNINYVRIPLADGGFCRAKIEGENCHLDIQEPTQNVDVSGYNSVSANYEKLTDEVEIIGGLLGEYAGELVADDEDVTGNTETTESEV